jgi:general secretion pathway protein I
MPADPKPAATMRPGTGPAPTRHTGFTLIEVMIALAVLAIALAAVMRTVGQSIDLTTNLRDRNIALWVAQNRLLTHQLQGDFPSATTTEGTSEMGGREWRWREAVTTTPEPKLRRIEIEVRLGAGDSAIARLVGFLKDPS